MTNWVHDYETLINCFVAVFVDYKSDEKKVFIVHELQNDYPELYAFLQDCKHEEVWHISFNGINFDSQITEFIIREGDYYLDEAPEIIAHTLYLKAQDIIERSNKGDFPEYAERILSIKQLDALRS